MADDHDSLLREVKEEIRREQLQKLWERYNALIVGAAVLIIVAVGAYKFIQNRRIAAGETAGAQFSAAEDLSNQKKKNEAEKAFAKLADGSSEGYAALAKLQLAGMQVDAGKTADAVATYDSLAKQSGADGLLKSFAQLQAASLRLPDADYSEIQNRLTPLVGDNAPYANSARELLGVAAYKAKKYDEARKYLEPLLIDPRASDAMQDRVKVVMADIASAETAAAPKSAANDGAGGGAQGKTEAKPDAASGAGSEKKP